MHKKRKVTKVVSSKEREAEIITPRRSKALAPKAVPSKALPPSSSQEVLKSALLIGMVHDAPPTKNITLGQGGRDRIRCQALEALGYTVETMDNKHGGQSTVNYIVIPLSLFS